MEIFEFIEDVVLEFKKDERTTELSQVAREMGFRFRKRERFRVQGYLLKEFPLFEGKNKKWFVGISSKADRDTGIFSRVYDYVYHSDLGKKTTTVFEIKCKKIALPSFYIYPKSTLEQVKQFFIKEDKAFEYLTEFHAAYQFHTNDLNTIEQQLNDEILDIIAAKKGIHLMYNHDYLLLYYPNEQIKARDIQAEYRMLEEIVALLLKPI
jgi:hypothetical protein